MNDFIAALGLMAVIEGLLYAAAPGILRRAFQRMLDMPDGHLRLGGIVAMTVGVVLVWSIRG